MKNRLFTGDYLPKVTMNLYNAIKWIAWGLLSVPLVASIALEFPEDESTCMTISGGPRVGIPCILPFKKGSHDHDKCIWQRGDNNGPWCSTKIDKDGYHVGGDNNWGYCSPKCPITPRVKQKEKVVRERQCIPLDDCPYYFDLTNRTIPGLSKELVQREIENQTCGGFNEKTREVNCPIDLEFDDTRHDVFGTKTAEFSCSGSLRIVHASKDEVGEFQTLSLGGKKKDGSERMDWPNIRVGYPVLETNLIISLEGEGNCCWRIYEKKGFQGGHEDVGGKHFPEFQAISVKKRGCGGVGDEYDYDDY